jgi:nucleoside-diphosphate-sugar epimerase
MRKEVVLITGANGEIGHGLISHIAEKEKTHVLALDVMPLDESLRPLCERFIQGDILDQMLLGRLVAEYEIRTIYHLASILSTKAEYNPETAHKVNVEGTLNLLRLAVEQATWQGKPVKFLYPSSIAVYGIPDLETKNSINKINEEMWCQPTTMYGCNKLYCEQLGRYYTKYYRQLAADRNSSGIDFRALRFPGLISAITTPTGGTSDYGPEMLHHAAMGKDYRCFVRQDTRLPFMVMPDAIKALLDLERAEKNKLSKLVYNVTSFNPSAQEFYDIVIEAFPNGQISFEPDTARQGIVDTWPSDVDDTAAKNDWGWNPEFDQDLAFNDYLIPAVKARYT